ncbi:3-oxoacyl-reductase [Annulohypoxylon maeteangense]|uniref:3-oxoacyl-reductase n=1 Tax=Annulohypoxylon maeteangense TaxID=1927788 RepID=UPI0020085C3E|nr:3-oxoacyl-reductase [Annulohypoxylon maeteangense]KAI0886117.1 3-oxoacyl-reductase [Annulohypoxylon maeteangense]
MTSSLTGKVILLTGAASGIGQGTAIKLHTLGAVLAITDINEAGIIETLELCGGGNDSDDGSKRHTTLVLDVSNAADVVQRVAEVVAKYGRIDHVFNCAGINPTSMPLTETSEEYFDRLVGVNLKGVYNVTKATMPHMTTPGGSYVNVSSISGWKPTRGTAIYCATKFGVIGFSQCMALELGPKNIRVNVIAPGYIDTPTNAGIAKGTPEARKGMEQGNALGRMGTPDDVAGVVAFLMSDEARYMNGSVVGVDGMLNT